MTTTALAALVVAVPSAAQRENSGEANGNPLAIQDDRRRGDGALPMMDHRFLGEAALGSLMEIETSRLAEQRAGSDEVRRFARRMIEDHQRSTRELITLAQRKGVDLPMAGVVARQGAGLEPRGNRTDRSGVRSDVSGSRQVTGGNNLAVGDAVLTQADMDEVDRLRLRHMVVEMADARSLLSQLSGPAFDQAYMALQVKDHAKMTAAFELHARHGQDRDVRAWASRTLPVIRHHYQMAREIAGLPANPARGREVGVSGGAAFGTGDHGHEAVVGVNGGAAGNGPAGGIQSRVAGFRAGLQEEGAAGAGGTRRPAR